MTIFDLHYHKYPLEHCTKGTRYNNVVVTVSEEPCQLTRAMFQLPNNL